MRSLFCCSGSINPAPKSGNKCAPPSPLINGNLKKNNVQFCAASLMKETFCRLCVLWMVRQIDSSCLERANKNKRFFQNIYQEIKKIKSKTRDFSTNENCFFR